MISHNQPLLGDDEQAAASRVINSGWVAQGPETRLFEAELCQFLGLPEGHVVAVSSGTAALFLSLWVLDAKKKRSAIPAYSCSALSNAIQMMGGEPIILDSSEGNPNVGLDKFVTPDFSIAVVPHMFGIPVDLSNIDNVEIIEDCAQAIGAKVNSLPVGLQGRLGVYSFSATKLMTTGGQGGAVVSKDKDLIDQIRDYREFDGRRDKNPRFNFQITDIQAAIGRVQLEKLPRFLERRQLIFKRYNKHAPLLQSGNKSCRGVPYRAIFETSNPQSVIQFFGQRKITCINPMNRWELASDGGPTPNADQLSQSLVSLPIYPALNEEAMCQVTKTLSQWQGSPTVCG